MSWRSGLWVLSVFALLVGCGGESERKRDPDEGESGRGGTGNASSGGSSGFQNPSAIGLEASLRPALLEDNPDGRSCQVQPNGSRSYMIGRANGDGTVENGKDGVEVSCFVTEDGQLAVELSAENQAVGQSGSFGMSLSGAIDSKTDVAQNTGSLGFRDAYAGLLVTNATTPPCTFGPPTAGGAITQKAGALLAKFTCPLILSVDSPSDGCRAEGTIAIEYCGTVAGAE